MRIAYFPVSIIATAVLVLTSPGLCQTKEQPHCLSYEPTQVTLEGVLVRRTFPGPPNYENVKKGDKAETSWFLDLQETVCVDEDVAAPDLNQKQKNIHGIQLVLNAEQYARYKAMVGRKVVVTGALFGEHTAHHHTPVPLTVRTLEMAAK